MLHYIVSTTVQKSFKNWKLKYWKAAFQESETCISPEKSVTSNFIQPNLSLNRLTACLIFAYACVQKKTKTKQTVTRDYLQYNFFRALFDSQIMVFWDLLILISVLILIDVVKISRILPRRIWIYVNFSRTCLLEVMIKLKIIPFPFW